MNYHITLIEGDGIGPEVMASAVEILDASGVDSAVDGEELDDDRLFEKALSELEGFVDRAPPSQEGTAGTAGTVSLELIGDS